MTLRPSPAGWFELLVLKDDLPAALEALSRAAAVEPETIGEPRRPLPVTVDPAALAEFEQLEQRFSRYWPVAERSAPRPRVAPGALIDAAMRALRDWKSAAAELIARLEARQTDRDNLLALRRLYDSATAPALADICRAGPLLAACCFELPSKFGAVEFGAGTIAQRIKTSSADFVIAVGLTDEIATCSDRLLARKARRLSLPDDVDPDVDSRSALAAKLRQTDTEIATLTKSIAESCREYDVASALADIQFADWYAHNVPGLSSTEHFAWVTGWTSVDDEQTFLNLLAARGIKGLVQLTAAPEGSVAPVLFRNPRWLRPFEFFPRLLGTPSTSEADPTGIVAIATPLMFGYMFGDVGHGFVLLLVGLVLGRRFEVLRLLVWGGIASMGFGVLFGSVFTIETLFAPLWLHPLDEPLLILALPLIVGAAMIVLGLFLDALQFYWRRTSRQWWIGNAGLLLCYVSLLAAIGDARFLWLAALGAVWYVAGHAAVAKKKAAAAANAAVEMAETLLQLIVNTISFVRVGAFALAHGGLATAIVGIAAAGGGTTATVLILIVGNALIIALEGLVVSIQTTRLILFEFFVRFLKAEGRPFRPLPPPDDRSVHV